MALSRFEHVEDAPTEGAEAPARALDRFGEEREHEAPHQHGEVDPMQPGTVPEPLKRFDGDGGEGLGLELGHEREMPIKRCHLCQTDLSKFEEHCHACGAPLDTEEARRFNEALWAEQKAQREAEEKASVERMYERVREGARSEEAVQDAMGQLEVVPLYFQVALWAATAVALVVGFRTDSGWVQLACIAWVGVFLLTRLSSSARDYLVGLFFSEH
jgi:hypothetical protein